VVSSNIKPPYPFADENEPVELFLGPAVLRQQMLVFTGTARVFLAWLPTPNISFELHGEGDDLLDVGATSCLELASVGVSAPVALTRVSSAGEVAGHVADRVTTGSQDEFSSLVFMLANTPQMAGEAITDGASYWRGRVALEAAPWRLTLEARRDADVALKRLRSTGGYVLTHVCSLERIDEAQFGAADADDVLRALHHFLSFATGLWTPPLLLTGVRADQIVWREWYARTSGPWRGQTSWFSPRHPDALVATFPTFMQRWIDPRWKAELQSAISWLVEAMRQPFADIAIALAQVALELLGWVILVEERQRLSRSAYKKQAAEEKLRQLLTWAGIPVAIPTELPDLTTFASASNWNTGPHALAGFRNMLVHPRDRTRTIFEMPISAKLDLQQLAFWYVELVLLRFIGYRGDYVNRHRAGWVGEVEPVPWS
jgi:hypothetical protein